MTRTVLVISNQRPEDNGGRAEKLATRRRRLAEFGWELEIGYVPEPYVRSFGSSLVQCYRRARAVGADVINSINNPFHLHLIGYAVSRLTDTPWLVEYRDPILTIPDRTPGDPTTVAAALTEHLAVRAADRLVWFDGIQLPDDYFETTYPRTPTGRFEKLPPIGFEADRFEAAPTRTNDRFTVVYAGSFYEGWIEPDTFLEALAEYSPEEAKPLVAEFYGDWDERYQRIVEDTELEDIVMTHGYVPFENVLPVLKGADVLLYIGGNDPENARNLPTKLYDYVGARTPILGLVDPEFRAAEFIREHRLGLVAPPNDPAAIRTALERLHTGGFEYRPDPEVFEYTRERSVRAYASVLDEITGTD